MCISLVSPRKMFYSQQTWHKRERDYSVMIWRSFVEKCLRHIRTPCLTGNFHFGGCDGRYFSSSKMKRERNTLNCGSLSGAVYELQHCPFREGCFRCIRWMRCQRSANVELTTNHQCLKEQYRHRRPRPHRQQHHCRYESLLQLAPDSCLAMSAFLPQN